MFWLILVILSPWLSPSFCFSIPGTLSALLYILEDSLHESSAYSSQYVVSYLFNFLPPRKHATASALFITVRETPVELPVVCHYYRADGDEGWERWSEEGGGGGGVEYRAMEGRVRRNQEERQTEWYLSF